MSSPWGCGTSEAKERRSRRETMGFPLRRLPARLLRLRKQPQRIDHFAVVRVAHPDLDHLVEDVGRRLADERLAAELLRELHAVLRILQAALTREADFLSALAFRHRLRMVRD